jgi:molybdenum cofactor synthesis domain-containing protein
VSGALRSAAILVVGDEVLSGEVADQNGPHLVERLSAAAVGVRRIVVAPDDEDAIASELARLRALADAVVVCGGIGPTHDDRTRPALARALGLPLEPHVEATERIARLFAGRATGADLAMAHLPRGARLLVGPATATIGFVVAGVYALPGVPFLVRDLVGVLLPDFSAPPLHRTEILTWRSEGEIAGHLAQCQAQALEVRIGSYPVFEEGRWRVRVVLRSEDRERLAEVAREVEGRIA